MDRELPITHGGRRMMAQSIWSRHGPHAVSRPQRASVVDITPPYWHESEHE